MLYLLTTCFCADDNIDSESELEQYDEEVWTEEVEDISLTSDVPEEEQVHMQTVNSQAKALSMWLIRFFFSLQVMYHVSDNALGFCLNFFKVFFSVLGHICKVSADIAELIPSSLYRAKLGIGRPKFVKYVVCRKCHCIYYFSECVESSQRLPRSKLCSFKPFPLHPHERMRGQCGALLLKSIESASGKTYFYPNLTYCYLGLKLSVENLLMQPHFFPNGELWRSRKIDEGTMRDVYDGQIWSDFQFYDNEPFLSEPGNYGLMLNMDFFQPYKHVQYSLGAIYITVLNLPRTLRNKANNVILVGLIPGPHEPKHDINSFLTPLVSELKEFWGGVQINVHSMGQKIIRCALLCIACDLPAGRKVCGFLSHNAHLGCSRCWKKFSGSIGSMDFAGFDRENWRARTGTEHRMLATRLLSTTTKTERAAAESSSGCRYSVLLDLPYLNAPRMLIVDPMHNLFLGSAKHFMKAIVVERMLLSNSQFDLLQHRMDRFSVPPNIGRIPHKIQSGFASFTADQWKNWVIYFSLIAMHDILDSDVLECWRHFVLGCRVLCRKNISAEKVHLGDAHLMQFCKRMERIFGRQCITPNMHMHGHLRSCMLDYGPLHGFWLYAFERYNGILGNIPHNNHSIEVQIMSRFLRDNEAFNMELPSEYTSDFRDIFPDNNTNTSRFIRRYHWLFPWQPFSS